MLRPRLPRLALALSLASAAAAQVVVQPKPPINLTGGLAYERGTNISAAPRPRGLAANPLTLPPRTAGEVWTNKLVCHAWAMESTLGSANFDVYFTRSLDGGVSYAPRRRLDQQVGSAREVTVVLNGHDVCVTWISNEAGGIDEQVFALVSRDQGASFTGPHLLNDPAIVPLGDAEEHWTAAGLGAFYVVWEFDDRGRTATNNDEDVRFVRIELPAGPGVVIGPDVRLNQPGSSFIDDVDSPIVVADPGSADVAVLWFDDRGGVAGVNALYGMWSRAQGRDFPLAQDTRFTGPPIAEVSGRNNVRGEIAAGRLHLMWEDRRNQLAGGLDEPFYNRLDLATGALLHAGDRNLTDWVPAGSHDMDQPFLAVNNANPLDVIVCWHDDRDFGTGADNGYNDVFATISRDGGMTWTPNVRVSRTSGLGSRERNECFGVAWAGDHIVISAERSAGNVPTLTNEDSILFISQDAGLTWSVEFLTKAGSSYVMPGIDIDDPFVVLTPGRHDAIVSFGDGAFGAGNDLVATGLRMPYVSLTAPFRSGNTVQFQVKQIGESNRGGITYLVYNSLQSGVVPGFYPFGGGIDVDLVFDPITLAFSGITALTVLTTPSGGLATTAAFLVPRGNNSDAFQLQAVVFDAQLRVRETTDPLRF